MARFAGRPPGAAGASIRVGQRASRGPRPARVGRLFRVRPCRCDGGAARTSGSIWFNLVNPPPPPPLPAPAAAHLRRDLPPPLGLQGRRRRAAVPPASRSGSSRIRVIAGAKVGPPARAARPGSLASPPAAPPAEGPGARQVNRQANLRLLTGAPRRCRPAARPRSEIGSRRAGLGLAGGVGGTGRLPEPGRPRRARPSRGRRPCARPKGGAGRREGRGLRGAGGAAGDSSTGPAIRIGSAGARSRQEGRAAGRGPSRQAGRSGDLVLWIAGALPRKARTACHTAGCPEGGGGGGGSARARPAAPAARRPSPLEPHLRGSGGLRSPARPRPECRPTAGMPAHGSGAADGTATLRVIEQGGARGDWAATGLWIHGFVKARSRRSPPRIYTFDFITHFAARGRGEWQPFRPPASRACSATF